jgi:hypothetical protein
MLDAPPGMSAADGTSHAALCPSCNTSRIGNFRFCRSCLHDFDQGSPRGLSDASVGMARARSAEMAAASMASLGIAPESVASQGTDIESSPDGPWGMTPPDAGAAIAAPTAEAAEATRAVDLLTLAPDQSFSEPRSATIERLIQSLETRVERGTRAEGVMAPRAEPVTVQPTRRRIPRRVYLLVAVIAIALLGVSGAVVFVLGRGAAAGQIREPPAAVAAASAAATSPSAISSPTPLATYSAAIRPGPITFGSKLVGVTVGDPTTRIKVGQQVVWVARMSQPTIEPAVELSVWAIVATRSIVIHRESLPIGLNGMINANSGVNSRDLGVGKFVVRYMSQGTILAEGTFTVVK